ncbi:MAG: hypothetical protein KatS3mg051_0606 [Anaerolineae bacterium]|nr:MAG: hypothetical protein KatS3mg051_0606 [Anaerolineae bacterium]
MAYADLREFVARLEEAGELIRVRTPVSPRLEITEITDRVSKGPAAHNKALLFENVEGSTMPVLINAFRLSAADGFGPGRGRSGDAAAAAGPPG